MKSSIEQTEDGKWRYTSSLVSNKYEIEYFYYHRTFEPWRIKPEQDIRMIINMDFHKAALLELGGEKNISHEKLLEACMFLVNQDFRFFGDHPSSKLIKDVEAFKKVVSVLQYISRLKLARNNIIRDIKGSPQYKDLFVRIDIEKLIKKCTELMGVNEEQARICLDYLSLNDAGSLFEFPIIIANDSIIFNPSSVILNDWHFSYVNGHYAKKIKFINRDEMISTPLINIVDDIVKLDDKLMTVKEKYYEFNEDGKIEKSDVDYAIYDPIKNVLLVLECKWKDNHYVSEVDYNNIKIQKSVFEIHNRQISKHKKFIDNYGGMKTLFGIENTVPEKILYLAIDKRNQIYFEEEKMMSVYMLATLIINSVNDNRLNIESVIDEIESLKTVTEYIYIQQNEKLLDLGEDIIVYTDEL